MANADVNIVVGAKDQASKILDEVGDNTRRLGRRVSTMSKKSVKANRAVALSFQSVKAAMGPLLAALAAYKAATAAFRFVGESAEAFDVQKEAVRGLTKAIELSGDTVGPTIEQHEAFASALQVSANVGDEVTLGLMKQASMLGVSNDQLQQTTSAAIGLAEATGQSLETALRKTVEATNGSTSSLARYLPALKAAETEEEKLAIITEAANKGLAQKAERADTAQGAGERLSNSWGDFKEVIGDTLAPVRKLVLNGLAYMVETIQNKVIPAVSTVKTVFSELPLVWDLVESSTKLFIKQISGSIGHALTEVIPGYASWFAENFDKIWRNAFEASVAVVTNAAKQIGQILSRMWEFVSSGFEGGTEGLFSDIGDIAGQSLMEGFTARTSKLPEIASRQVSDAERALMAKVEGLTEELTGKINSSLAEKLGSGGVEAGSSIVEGLKSATKGAADDVVKEATKRIKQTADESSAKVNRQAGELQATESRLLSRGNSQNGVEQRIQETNRMLARANRNDERAERLLAQQLVAMKNQGGLQGVLVQ